MRLASPLTPRPCKAGKLRPKDGNARFRVTLQTEHRQPWLLRPGSGTGPWRRRRIHCAAGETEACKQGECPDVASGAPHPATARRPRPTRPGSPAAPASPAPPRTRPRRRWQQHLHIWRPCSRFRDGARAATTSPRTTRATARTDDVPGADMRAWSHVRKGWGLVGATIRKCVTANSQSSSPSDACVVSKARDAPQPEGAGGV